MARYPRAKWVGEESGLRPMSRYDIFCIHTIVGFAPAHAAHFSTSGAGNVYQSRDTRFQSAANLNGNPRIIASENADHGDMFNGGRPPVLPRWVPLTDAQVEENGLLFKWLHDTHKTPLQLCPDSRPGSRGLAYHRQGIDGNFGGYKYGGRVAGGEVWTSSFGKACPTDIRIDQLPLILEVAKEGVDPMAEYDKQLGRIEELLGDLRADSISSTRRIMKRLSVINQRNKAILAGGKVSARDFEEVQKDLDDLQAELEIDVRKQNPERSDG